MSSLEERKKLMKELAVVSAIAIPVIVELAYQIYQYIERRKKENG